jgi:hypothetical protein
MVTEHPPAKFGHFEITCPVGLLSKENVEKLDAFWCDVFGWTSGDVVYPEFGNMHQHRIFIDGQALILTESDDPMTLPAKPVGMGPGETVIIPHLGIELGSVEEVERVLAAVQEYQAKDPEVKLWDAGENRFPGHGGLHHAFLVAYMLPVWFDVYATRWDPGREPQRSWKYVDSAVADLSVTADL